MFNKQWRLWWVAFCLVVCLFFMARQAKAFVDPWLPILGPQVATAASGATATGFCIPCLMAIGALAAVAWPSSLSPDDMRPTVRVPVGRNDGSGFSQPVAAPTKPGTGAWSWKSTAATCTNGLRSGFDSRLKAMEDYVAMINGLDCATGYGAYRYEVCDAFQMKVQGSTCYVPTQLEFDSVTVCPRGYKMVGGLCKLDNPRAAEPDGKCDYGRIGNQFKSMDDIDCERDRPAVILPDGRLLMRGKDANGNPVYYTADPRLDGSVGLRGVEQLSDPAGNSYLRDTQLTIGPDGGITQGSQTTQPGSIDKGSTSPTSEGEPVREPQPKPAPQPNADPEGSGPIDFPDDYAREGTLQKLSDETVQQGKDRNEWYKKWDKFEQSAPAPADPKFDEGKDKYVDPFKDLVKPFQSFRLDTSPGACPVLDLSFVLFQHNFDLRSDVHCTIFDKFRSIIAAACLAIYALGAVLIILSA